jgi:hypothetical protein
MLSAIRGYKGPLLHTYDINCQFSKNLWGRVARAPDDLKISSKDVDIVFKCPMMHLKGHERKCQAPFSLHFCRGAGHTSGETIETLWPPLNALAASTREMGPGHRRDMLDVGIGFQNWTKTMGFGAFASTRGCVFAKPTRGCRISSCGADARGRAAGGAPRR